MSIALYSSKHDISYTPYNNKNIPWNINTTYICQNNQTDLNEPTTNKNIYQYFKNINNSLVIESSQNNIILLTSQNTNVIVKNNMAINTDLDVSNVTTKLVKAHDISLNRKLYLNSSLPINIIGNLRINGSISISESSSNTLTESKSEFTNLSIIVNPTLSGGSVCELFDVSINTTKIILSKLYSVSIKNSYIYDSPIGYDRYNNLAPSWAIFSDVVLDSLTLDSSLNIQSPSLIKFNNNNNNTNSIIIRSSNNNSRLEITKPLIIGQTNQSNNIIDSSNISIFNGDISCGALYYSQLYPDVRLNNYFDISIGAVSISGNSIPNKNTFNIGSTNFKFTNTYSRNFIGNLSGEALSANDLQRNLDMSFNILDIEGAFNFNGNNLEQSLIGNFLSLSGGDVSFSNVNSNIQDLSSNSGVNIGILKNYIDTCFNNPIFSYIRDISTKIVEVSSNLNVLKNYIDTCFNNPLYRRINDISTIIIEVSSNIVPVKTYFDSCFNNLLYRRITDVSSSLNTLKTNNQTSFNNIYTKTATQSYFTSNYVTLSYYNLTNIYNITEMNTLFNPKSNFNTRIQYANSNYYHYNILNTFPVSNELNIINIASNKNGNIIVAGYPNTDNSKFIIWELKGTSYVNSFERTYTNFIRLSDIKGAIAVSNKKLIDHNIVVSGWSWQAVCWSPQLNLFAAVSYGGTEKVMTSPDGVNWTGRLNTYGNGGFTDICWSAERGRFVAISDLGKVLTSSDGLTWTYGTNIPAGSWKSICWSPLRLRFVAVSYANNLSAIMSSPDGFAWTIRLAGTATNSPDWVSVCWSPELTKFVAIGGGKVGNSSDGENWLVTSIPSTLILFVWCDICWSPKNMIFVAVALTGYPRTMTSVDGTTWIGNMSAPYGVDQVNNRWTSVCWSVEAELFFAISNSGPADTGSNKAMTSPDGITWTLRETPSEDIHFYWQNVCWSPQLGIFVAVGYSEKVLIFSAQADKVGISVAISYSGYVVAVAAYKIIRVYYRRSEAIGWVELDTPPPALDGFEGTSFEPYVQYSMLKQPDYGTAETFDFAHNINNLAVSDIGDTEAIIMGVGWRLDRVNMYFYSGGTRTYDYSTATITRSGGSWTTQVIYASDINQPTDRDFGSNMTFAEANIYYGHNICFSVGRTILTYKCIFDFNPTRLRCVQDVPPFSLTIGNDGDIITSLKILVGNTQYGQAEATVIAVGVAKHNFVGVYTRSGYNQSWVLCYSLYGTTYGYSSPISRFGACVHVCHRFGGGHLLAISVPNKIINTTDTAIRGTVEIFYLSTFDSSILPKRFTTIIPSNYNYGSSFPDYNRYFGAGSITITETKLVAAPRMVYTITYTYLHQLGYLNMPLYFSNQNYTTNLTVQFFYSIDPVRFDFNSYGYYTSNFPTTSASQDIAKFQKTGQTAIIFKGDGTISYRSTRSSFSDVRLKDNIIDTPSKLQDVLKVRVVNFKFKGADNGKHIGVIAQELEAIFPDLVSDVYPSQQDIKLGKTEIYKAVRYSSFDVILIKAFQEQLAIINNLTFQLDEIDDKCRVLQKIKQESAVLDQELYILKRENNIFKKYINEVLKLMNKEIIY